MNELGEQVAKMADRAPDRDGEIVATDRVVQSLIDAEDAGQRLDNYLFRQAKGVPKSHVYRIIRGGEVRINRRRVDADYRLQAGDLLRMPPLRVAQRAPIDPTVRNERAVALPIVHEDEDLLIIDKPAGVAVHGGSGIAFGVIEQLRQARPNARFLELAHRLDRETSGLLMVAKKRSALTRLHDDLREGRVRKRYRACVAGPWREQQRRVSAPLVKFLLPDGERRVRVATEADRSALEALTIFHRVETFESADGAFALLDVDLRTGRTHQIRVHLAHLGRPIVGDDKYGDFALNKRLARSSAGGPAFRRMFLHAAQLAIVHPRTQEAMRFESPLPDACERFLQRLRGGA